jgi:hypothetical protein
VTMQGSGTVEATAKVLRQDQWGNTRLKVGLDSVRLSGEMMGHKMQMTIQGGKLDVIADGQKVAMDKIPMLPGGQAIPLLEKPIEVKFGTRGQLMDMVIPGFEKEMAQMKQLYGGLDPMTMWKQTQILLPENPVAVGDTWNDHQEQPMPGGGTAAITDTTFNLTDIKEVNGQKIAEIAVSSTSTVPNLDMGAMMRQGMPGGAPPPVQGMGGNMAMETRLAGKVMFNVSVGLMDRFDFRLDYDGRMNTTMPNPQQQGASISMAMSMQGQFTGAVARLK